MVRSINETLHYNEQKVAQGIAVCLHAENFIKNLDQLNWEDKIYHFKRIDSMNQLVKKKAVHITLNFHPTDRLSNADLVTITHAYMGKMGFGEQPYLVYRHLDVAHPHVHVATSRIGKDHKGIAISRPRLQESYQICKEMERRYSLAVSGEKIPEALRKDDRAQKIAYGQVPTMAGITRVLNRVVPNYKYTTLDEFNAVLRPYNVEASRGLPDSRLYRYRGLIYRVLDHEGQPTGGQIKSSLFDLKPTLDKLEKKFALNQSHPQRQKDGQRVRTAVDWALLKEPLDLPGLQKALEKERINMVQYQDKKGGLLRVFFVDHLNRSVFDGKSLGERYDARGLQQRCISTEEFQQKQRQTEELTQRQDQRSSILKGLS